MHHAPRQHDFPFGEGYGLIRRIFFLVIYLFVASLFCLSATSVALASEEEEHDHYYDRDHDGEASCRISPQNPSIDAGGSVTWSTVSCPDSWLLSMTTTG